MMATKYVVYFLILKTFDKVWQPGLHYKLRQNGISSNTLTNFVGNRTQMIILNGQYSSWAKIEAGVPQGSILGPLLFLIYIFDLPENLASNPTLFPDDTSLISEIKNDDSSNIDLNNSFKKIGEWAFQWKMNFSPDTTKQAQELIISHIFGMTNALLYLSIKMSFRKPSFKSI